MSGPVSARSTFDSGFLPLSAPGPAAVNSSVYLDPSRWTLFRNPAYVYSERASSGSLDPTRQRDDREADTAVGANPQRGDLPWPFRWNIYNQSPRSWLPATYATGGIFNSKIYLIRARLRAFMDTRLTPPRKETALEIQVREQIEDLQHMTVGQLREKYREVFGEESRSYHKQFLFRGVALGVFVPALSGSGRPRRSESVRKRRGVARGRCLSGSPEKPASQLSLSNLHRHRRFDLHAACKYRRDAVLAAGEV